MDALSSIGGEYLAALKGYLESRSEDALGHAYQLGRRALLGGLGVLDVAMFHRAAVEAVVLAAAAADQPRLAHGASDFFHEALSPFEMSLRGYRSANDELRRLNEALRARSAAVETANRELESFSYSVSHDLRAPLRRIDGFGRILLEDYADRLDGEGAAHLARIREATRHMGQLIDDLLGLARVTRAEMNAGDVDLAAIARRIAEQLRAAAPERAVDFAIEADVRARGDARLLAVALENLLGNAWKFTSKRERAAIAFGSRREGGVTSYFVRDNGAGFDMAHAAKLFGAFQRLHSPGEFEGTGIGLATVERIIRRHGGRIWAEGEVDRGAIFHFSLG